ncbi:MAG: hypothetical protein KDA75_06770 [Planctomycetaceae bacterium]|nr:hypothetical protein [Planctomycetaceae bacterium]
MAQDSTLREFLELDRVSRRLRRPILRLLYDQLWRRQDQIEQVELGGDEWESSSS